MVDNNNRLLQLLKIKNIKWQTQGDIPASHHWKLISLIIKDSRDTDKKKAHNPTERWTKAKSIVNKKGNANRP